VRVTVEDRGTGRTSNNYFKVYIHLLVFFFFFFFFFFSSSSSFFFFFY